MFGKEYVHDGKTYRFVVPDANFLHRIGCVQQRTKAHQVNGNHVGIYQEIAESWAIMLGIPVEEAAELPLRFFTEIMRDGEDFMERYKKAFGK